MVGLKNYMRAYELVLVLKSSLKDTERKKITEGVKGLLKSFKFEKENEWGEKLLSYNIKKQASGFFLDISFEGEVLPNDFEKKLFGDANILRHLLIRKK